MTKKHEFEDTNFYRVGGDHNNAQKCNLSVLGWKMKVDENEQWKLRVDSSR